MRNDVDPKTGIIADFTINAQLSMYPPHMSGNLHDFCECFGLIQPFLSYKGREILNMLLLLSLFFFIELMDLIRLMPRVLFFHRMYWRASKIMEVIFIKLVGRSIREIKGIKDWFKNWIDERVASGYTRRVDRFWFQTWCLFFHCLIWYFFRKFTLNPKPVQRSHF